MSAIKTSPKARVREDRAGDPLDGLVNLFDLGIVLAVAFLLAALSSLKLTGALIHHTRAAPQIAINQNQTTQPLNLLPNQRVIGHGTPAGQVYRLGDGRLVYVAPATTTTTSPATTPSKSGP
jgi:hypothetical protein